MKEPDAMNCQDVEPLLTSYRLGELPEVQARAVALHLSTCPGCQAAAREINATLDLLQAALASDGNQSLSLEPARRKRVRQWKTSGVRLWLMDHAPLPLRIAALLAIGLGIGLFIAYHQRAPMRAAWDWSHEGVEVAMTEAEPALQLDPLAPLPPAKPMPETTVPASPGLVFSEKFDEADLPPAGALAWEARQWPALPGNMEALLQQQHADGSWANHRVDITAACLLRLLAENPAASNPAQRAVVFLVRRQDAQGRYAPDPASHALATWALARAFTVMPGKPLDQSLARAVAPLDVAEPTPWQLPALKALQTAQIATQQVGQAMARAHPAREKQRPAPPVMAAPRP